MYKKHSTSLINKAQASEVLAKKSLHWIQRPLIPIPLIFTDGVMISYCHLLKRLDVVNNFTP